LVEAAVASLGQVGFAGASARDIARRAGCNQGLVFYHFGSVANLLLAALDEVSRQRLARYEATVAQASDAAGLVSAARSIFEEDLAAGYMTVLAEMIAGASSVPGLGAEVAARIAPWEDFARDALGPVFERTGLAALLPAQDVAYAVVALYLGLELRAHLDGDPGRALGLFERLAPLAGLLGALAGAGPDQERREETT
jgi:AcrR family transcriptional regulator